jgi:MFS family permease
MPMSRINIRWNASALLVSVSTLPMLQAVLLTPILAVVRDSIGEQSSTTFLLRIIVAAPALTIVILSPFIGRLADRFQRRHILIFGLTLYAFCGAMIFAWPRPEFIFFSRLLLGAALACLLTATTALTGDLFDPGERNRILGLQFAAGAAVGMFFPVLAGSLALVNWRLTFLIYLVAAVLIVPAARLPDRPVMAPPPGSKATNFELRPIVGICALIGVGTLTLWLLTIQLAFHLKEIGLVSPVFAGLALGVPCLTGVLGGTLYERVRQRFGFRSIAALAFALIGIGYGVISMAASVPLVVLGLLFAGFGFGLNQPNCSAWLLSVVAKEVRGRAAAALTFAVCAGQLASPFVYQPLVAMAGSAASFAIMSGMCLMLATAVLLAANFGPLSDRKEIRASPVAPVPSHEL